MALDTMYAVDCLNWFLAHRLIVPPLGGKCKQKLADPIKENEDIDKKKRSSGAGHPGDFAREEPPASYEKGKGGA